jgi:hypothetical protein
MTADQLIAESIPDGTFGQAQPATGAWTRAEQDAHWNDLAEALGAYKDMRPRRRAA